MKKMSFIVAAVCFSFALPALAEEETEFAAEAETEVYEDEERTFTQYEAGVYKVGEDIPAGEYVVFADRGTGYFCVSSDIDQKDILFNDNFDYNSIITVNDGEYLNMKRCYAVPIAENPEVDITGTGMFLVGTHISAGEYKLDSGSDHGYYCIYSSSRQDDIVANDVFEGQDYAAVSDGQYLVLSRCSIADSGDSAPENTAEADSDAEASSQYAGGVYKVGVDIPAGEYVLFADDSGAGYFSVSADSNQSDILFNDNFEYNSIITVNDGEYLDMSRCYAVPISENPDVDISGAGMFLVGMHIPAGEYKLDSGGDNGYYCIYSSSRQDDIVVNGIFEGQNYVSVSDGQYLVLSRCSIVE